MMLAIIIISVSLSLAVVALRIKKNRYYMILLMLYMIIVFIGCAEGNVDLVAYQYRYNNYIYGLSAGFDLLMKIAKVISLNFYGFKAIVGAIYLLLMYYSIKKCTEYTLFVFGLLLIYPFSSAVTQMRNAFMAAIVLYTIINFVLDPKHSTFKFCVGILVAMLFHVSAIFYFLLLFVKVDTKKNKNAIALTIIIILLVELIIANNAIYMIASRFIFDSRVLNYLDFNAVMERNALGALNWKGQAVPIVGQCLGFIIFEYIYKRFRKELCKETYYVHINKKCFSLEQLNMIRGFMVVMFIMLPLYLLSPTYFRLYKNIVPLIYIVAAQYFSYTVKQKNRLIGAENSRIILFIGAVLAISMSAMAMGSFLENLNEFTLNWI